jgi:hypothetical protein
MFDDLNDKQSTETELQRIVFVEVRDSECGVVGWRYREDTHDISLESNRLFDTVDEAIESWTESRI